MADAQPPRTPHQPDTRQTDGDPPLYYERHVFVCVNERKPDHKRGSCAAGGAEKLHKYMKSRIKEEGLKTRIRVNQCGCLDRCELGPCMVIYPEGIWYSPRNEGDIDRIIRDHLLNGGRVPELMLRPEDGP